MTDRERIYHLEIMMISIFDILVQLAPEKVDNFSRQFTTIVGEPLKSIQGTEGK